MNQMIAKLRRDRLAALDNPFLLFLGLFVALGLFFGLTSCTAIAAPSAEPAGPTVQMLSATPTPDLTLPYSEAVRYGDTLYLAGQLGVVPGQSAVVPGGIQAETTQAMKNIAAVLQRHGSSTDKLIKCTIFLADIGLWGDMNVAYVAALGDHRPARSALGVSGLGRNAEVEIECLAGI